MPVVVMIYSDSSTFSTRLGSRDEAIERKVVSRQGNRGIAGTAGAVGKGFRDCPPSIQMKSMQLTRQALGSRTPDDVRYDPRTYLKGACAPPCKAKRHASAAIFLERATARGDQLTTIGRPDLRPMASSRR